MKKKVNFYWEYKELGITWCDIYGDLLEKVFDGLNRLLVHQNKDYLLKQWSNNWVEIKLIVQGTIKHLAGANRLEKDYLFEKKIYLMELRILKLNEHIMVSNYGIIKIQIEN